MSFADRMTRCPRPFNEERGQDVRALFSDFSPEVQNLISGTAACSPYLSGLLEKEAAWIRTALETPEDSVQSLYTELREFGPDDLPVALRRAKRRIAAITALADLSGVWPLEMVTGTLTDFADLATHLAMQATVGAEIKRGKLPGLNVGDLETTGGLVALAMGKMGAGELNYSSDIDLIVLFDETRFDPDEFLDARASFIRATRKMSGMLNDITSEGYVFRTDLRLRPDPSVTPVCLGMLAAERYYESLGRTWERAAYIKARACAGDIDGGQAFLKSLTPFVWRKHLDFAAIEDAHAMRLRIREHKGLSGPISLPGHHMKLGRGGIREIEFFTQTRQLIAGGRDPDLRVRETVQGLKVLASKGWLPAETAGKLIDHYRAHREVEHRMQMVNDAQTHALPGSDEGFQRLACMMDLDLDTMRSQLRDRLEEVHALTEDFFAPEAAPKPTVTHDFDENIIARWPNYAAMRSDRASEIFSRLKPVILDKLRQAAKPDEALIAFDGFLAGLPAGVQLFSLFDANNHLVDLLMDIVGTAPDLAVYLSRNASVFDAVLAGDFFADWPGCDALETELASKLADESDYERKLDTTRRWHKEWMFRVGVHHLRGLISAWDASQQYSDIAGAVLRALWPVVIENFELKYGPPPGRGAIILGMGSLGAETLHARSDLDLIVIYDAAGVEYSEGRKSLATRTYYARLTQAMVTAMSAPMAQGRLYEVDMRLRPSGNQGPVATSFQSFQDYQQTSAWTWEHLALTRARPIAGPEDLQRDVEAFRRQLIASARDKAKVFSDTAEMRQKIAAAKGEGDVWETKLGRGAMQDIELTAQALALTQGSPALSVSAGLGCAMNMSDEDQAALRTAYQQFGAVRGVAKLLSDRDLAPDEIGEGGRQFLLRETGFDSVDALKASLKSNSERANAIINKILDAGME